MSEPGHTPTTAEGGGMTMASDESETPVGLTLGEALADPARWGHIVSADWRYPETAGAAHPEVTPRDQSEADEPVNLDSAPFPRALRWKVTFLLGFVAGFGMGWAVFGG